MKGIRIFVASSIELEREGGYLALGRVVTELERGNPFFNKG